MLRLLNKRQYFVGVFKLYPEPKSVLHSYYSLIALELKISNACQINMLPQKDKWQCTYTVLWPEQKSFVAIERNKRAASKIAAYKCLQWLHSLNKINAKGHPILYSKNDLKKPEVLHTHENVIQKMDEIVKNYKQNVRNIVQTELRNQSQFSNHEIEHKPPIINHFTKNPIVRNSDLHKRVISPATKIDFPVLKFRSDIIEMLESNQVFLVQGATGSGKSTQIPQIIMDHFASEHNASSCNIVITQPRRISAVSIAERVAEERRERLGDVVGYEVRFEKNLPKYPGSILFCTTGMLRSKMISHPDLKGVSHVILDEAHERSVDTDILMFLIKRAMRLNPELKVIIMSATINTELFQKYFDCPTIKVEGRLYPVKMHFSEDITKLGIPPSNPSWIKDDNYGADNVYLDIHRIANVVKYIALNKPPGAILCFLPSWASITSVKDLLLRYCRDVNMQIITLHSKVSIDEQKKIFAKVSENCRKIILSTDIAETGITVPDVVYVVDSAMHKSVSWNEERCASQMVDSLISKANVDQRKGRAGRVQPGESYHLITKEMYENLRQFPLPEIKTCNLEKVVLDCKSYNVQDLRNVFKELPEPPSDSAVNEAISQLITLGALDEYENLTYLGKRISHFTEHPTLAKSLILARIFCCLQPIVTIAGMFSMNRDIFSNSLTDRAGLRAIKSKYQPYSDHLACVWLLQECQKVESEEDHVHLFYFFERNRLVPECVKYLKRLRMSIFKSLEESKMLNSKYISSKLNTYSELDEMVGAILLAGTNNLLHHRNFSFKDGVYRKRSGTLITETGSRGFLGPETVNYNRKHWPSPYLTYYRKMHVPVMRGEVIRESSMVSPLSVLLFSSGDIKAIKRDEEYSLKIRGKSNVEMFCNEESIAPILEFRRMMWEIVEYLYKMQPAIDKNPTEEMMQVEELKDEMLKILAEALDKASEERDNLNTENDEDKENDPYSTQ